MNKTIKEIVDEAIVAAKAASQEFIDKHGEPFYYGFAWVEVKVARKNNALAKELIAAGFKVSCKPKTLIFWDPSNFNTQSVDVKSFGANAFAKVMRANGISALAYDRLD